MKAIKIGLVGIGNCASSLLQGIELYKNNDKEDAIGILFWKIGGYSPPDIKVSCAFDIDKRKVGTDINEAIFAPPNCTLQLGEKLKPAGIQVCMGKVLDGFAEHMRDQDPSCTFLLSDEKEPTKEEVIRILQQSETEILVNYLPVGSEKATHFYAECALEAGIAFINNIPVFIASNTEWAKKFKSAGLPLIGDDIKSQMGATIIHRTLVNLFARRGVKLEKTYQMNTGGNTDFLNMKDNGRLSSKKISKTEAVKSVIGQTIGDQNIHIGPSDYVPWLKDNKVAFIRLEGKLFGDVPMNIELRMSVEDSPNSAGAAIDCIRLCKLGLDRKISGVLEAPSAFYCKHPPHQYTDDAAYKMIQKFISS